MLYSTNPVLLIAIKKEKVEQSIRQAEADRLVGQAEPSMQNRSSLPHGQSRHRLGQQLIAWGARLEHLGTKLSI